MTMGHHHKKHGEFFAVRLWAKIAAVCAVGCLAGLVFLRWVFWRDLGLEYAQTIYTLKSMNTYLIPTLVLSLLIVLFIASIAVFLVAVLASHKVAGPIFRLQRVGEHLDKSILIGHINLRQGDWLMQTADHINAWVAERKARHKARRHEAEVAHEMIRAMKVSAGTGDYAEARRTLANFLAKAESAPKA